MASGWAALCTAHLSSSRSTGTPPGFDGQRARRGAFFEQLEQSALVDEASTIRPKSTA